MNRLDGASPAPTGDDLDDTQAVAKAGRSPGIDYDDNVALAG
jgi:hypothetical protein